MASAGGGCSRSKETGRARQIDEHVDVPYAGVIGQGRLAGSAWCTCTRKHDVVGVPRAPSRPYIHGGRTRDPCGAHLARPRAGTAMAADVWKTQQLAVVSQPQSGFLRNSGDRSPAARHRLEAVHTRGGHHKRISSAKYSRRERGGGKPRRPENTSWEHRDVESYSNLRGKCEGAAHGARRDLRTLDSGCVAERNCLARR